VAKSVHHAMGFDPPDADDTKAGKVCKSPHEMMGMGKMGKGAGVARDQVDRGQMMSSTEMPLRK